jgi:hypothetical protein
MTDILVGPLLLRAAGRDTINNDRKTVQTRDLRGGGYPRWIVSETMSVNNHLLYLITI